MTLKTNSLGEPISVGSYRIHPTANAEPMMSALEQEALRLSIKKNGQREPVLLYRKQLIDGRCRTLACSMLGIEPDFIDLPHKTTLTELQEIVMDAATRRNKTATQKAIKAAMVVEAGTTMTQPEVFAAHGVSKPSGETALFILRNAKGIAEQLFNGEKIDVGKARPTAALSAVKDFIAGVKSPHHIGKTTGGNSVWEHECPACAHKYTTTSGD